MNTDICPKIDQNNLNNCHLYVGNRPDFTYNLSELSTIDIIYNDGTEYE